MGSAQKSGKERVLMDDATTRSMMNDVSTRGAFSIEGPICFGSAPLSDESSVSRANRDASFRLVGQNEVRSDQPQIRLGSIRLASIQLHQVRLG